MFLKCSLLPLMFALIIQMAVPPAQSQEKQFFVVNMNANWHFAFIFCRRLNMTLASITNESDQLGAQRAIADAGWTTEAHFWLSGTDQHVQDEFTWMSSGRPLRSYTNWYPGEPNNKGGNEHCVEMYVGPYSWNDRECNVHMYFLCEYFAAEPCGVDLRANRNIW